MSASRTDEQQAQQGLQRLDTLLQHRARLGACVLLAKTTALSFSRLKMLLEETDGNLGAQLRKLEEAGYLEVRKEFQNRKPVSWYSLTPAGRTALGTHIRAIQDLVALVPAEGRTKTKA
ncbi:MAG: transcriptional regulator [Candidatus Hydrogenedentes bacterium]|nr:transcriptional regulator [Candidatus Hydrogenedentota bacterium]